MQILRFKKLEPTNVYWFAKLDWNKDSTILIVVDSFSLSQLIDQWTLPECKTQSKNYSKQTCFMLIYQYNPSVYVSFGYFTGK